MAKPRKAAHAERLVAPPFARAGVQVGPAVLFEAQQLIVSGDHIAATRLLEAALGHAAMRPDAHNLLAISALMRELPATALPHAQEAVRERPGNARFQFTLGRAYKARNDLDGAASAYRAALQADPRSADAMVSLGIVLKTRGDLDEAIALYERALEISPRMMAAHANLANALALRAEREATAGADEEVDEAALDAQGRAVALDPRNARLHRNYGVLLLHARRNREAIAAFNESLTLDPTDVECCLRLGGSLASYGDLKLAREAYETWLERNPPSVPVMRALATALTRTGEVDLALDWSQKAIALDPDAPTLLSLGGTLMQARRLEESLARCREAIDLGGRRRPDLYSAFLLGLSYLHEVPEAIFAVHREFAVTMTPPADRPAWRPRPQRLRVGYVSADFIRHSVSYFIAGLLEHHDCERFEVFCYHNNRQSDGVTEHLKGLVPNWVECEGLSDDALRRRIVADGIDILVDLSGHTHGSRVFMFGLMAPAPVQIGYLGYPTVSGVPAMDFRITDLAIDPGDQPPLPHDLPLPLARSMFCYRPDTAAQLALPPALGNGYVTFGSFNNIAKVTDHALAMWAAAMNAVPGSRLLLKSTSMAQAGNRSNIERFMASQGIAADRLDLFAWQANKDGHLNMYNQVDIALDSFPYNGATTTCEALWMGVPVVSRRGATHTSRMGASILGAIGQSKWVADTDAAFVEIVVNLAADVPALARWRAESRVRLKSSELLDDAGFTRDFEAALEAAWERKGEQLARMDQGTALVEAAA